MVALVVEREQLFVACREANFIQRCGVWTRRPWGVATGTVILPSVILFTALYFFWRMTRTHELEVTRAAGFSVWNFLGPVAIAALLLGVVEVTIVNPLSAAMVGRYERMEDRFFRSKPTTLNISSAGIWISQADARGQAFIQCRELEARHVRSAAR